MEDEQRANLLKDEYLMLQKVYDDTDSKGLNIKNWAITVALAAIGTGLLYHKGVLLVSFAASIVFWYLEAYWRGLSYFYVVRIKEIEKAFDNGTWKKMIPFQVYSSWNKEFTKSHDQTLRYMIKRSSFLPHVIIAVISLLLYFLGGKILP